MNSAPLKFEYRFTRRGLFAAAGASCSSFNQGTRAAVNQWSKFECRFTLRELSPLSALTINIWARPAVVSPKRASVCGSGFPLQSFFEAKKGLEREAAASIPRASACATSCRQTNPQTSPNING